MAYPLHIRLAVALYLKLPIPLATRRKARDFLFRRFPRFFRQHHAYGHWQSALNPIDNEIQRLIKVHGRSPAMKAHPEHAWYELALAKRTAATKTESPKLDIIMPVYDGYDDTLCALYQAVTAPNITPNEIIVINDKSPNQPLTQHLRKYAAMGLFTLLENDKNLGFVQTVNRGFALHADRDCLILNADCMVYGDYADRLRAVAYSIPHVASVTPLSNNAEICSYPLCWRSNEWNNEISDEELDALAFAANGHQSVQVPTGVGFCMYMTRAAIDDIGVFDAKTFGRGYGEENDFCLRASAAGFTNLLATGVYARHVGGSSFQGEKAERVKHAIKTLDRLHPGYTGSIEAWRMANPAKEQRMALDLARLKLEDKPSILLVLHNWGGGTEKHVRDMARWLEQEGMQVFYLISVEGDSTLCQLGVFRNGDFNDEYVPNLQFAIREDDALLADILRRHHVRHIHVHHLIGYEDYYYEAMVTLAKTLGVAYDVTLHDYFAVCPRTNLIDEQNIYCGEPDESGCNRCISRNGSAVARYHHIEPEIGAWRSMHQQFLRQARHVYVPNGDVAARLSRYFADVTFTVKPHPEDFIAPLAPADKPKGIRRIALIGAMYPLKGAYILKELIADAHARKLPLEFHLFGFYAVEDPDIYRYPNFFESGKYKEKDLPALVAAANPELSLFISVWPETFSYTLSLSYQLGLYPVSFDIGAPAERIRDCGYGHLLPLAMANDVQAINDALVTVEIPSLPERLAVWDKQSSYPNLLRDYYGLEFGVVQTEPTAKAS